MQAIEHVLRDVYVKPNPVRMWKPPEADPLEVTAAVVEQELATFGSMDGPVQVWSGLSAMAQMFQRDYLEPGLVKEARIRVREDLLAGNMARWAVEAGKLTGKKMFFGKAGDIYQMIMTYGRFLPTEVHSDLARERAICEWRFEPNSQSVEQLYNIWQEYFVDSQTDQAKSTATAWLAYALEQNGEGQSWLSTAVQALAGNWGYGLTEYDPMKWQQELKGLGHQLVAQEIRRTQAYNRWASKEQKEQLTQVPIKEMAGIVMGVMAEYE